MSLGVQSFIAEGAVAHWAEAHGGNSRLRTLRCLRDAGIANINVDLIAGLPFQTRESWNESLEWVERIGVPHVSVYMLEVDDDSNLGRELLVLRVEIRGRCGALRG